MQALRLSHATLENTSSGTVMNLLSNDVYRFDAMSMFLNALWTAPLLCVTVGYLLWIEIRWASMFGLLIIFIIVPIQSLETFYESFQKKIVPFQRCILIVILCSPLDRLHWKIIGEISKSNSHSNRRTYSIYG